MGMKDPVLEQAAAWRAEGLAVGVATVVATWGSAPCPAGSMMAINEKAGFAGSVSGGCIETSVVSESLETVNGGGHEVLDYGVSGEVAFEAGLACGGEIEVLVEKLDDRLIDALTGPQPCARLVDLESGDWSLYRDGVAQGALDAPPALLDEAGRALGRETAGPVELDGRRYFVHPLVPDYRLIVVGAVRIAQVLAPMAAAAGFDVSVVDPRRAFATDERFPDVALVREWPDKALPGLGLDAHTAVVTLTHDAEPDDMALGQAVRSPAFYVGALGSRRTHAKRVDRLREAGCSEAEIARIQAPIGLDIGARTPAEIAVSILAQLVAAKNGAAGPR